MEKAKLDLLRFGESTALDPERSSGEEADVVEALDGAGVPGGALEAADGALRPSADEALALYEPHAALLALELPSAALKTAEDCAELRYETERVVVPVIRGKGGADSHALERSASSTSR